MSYDPLGGVPDAMLDSLSMQLRDAEVRRAEAERAHQVCQVSTAANSSQIYYASIYLLENLYGYYYVYFMLKNLNGHVT